MPRKYIVVNVLTGYPCFGGRRFWTARGAARKMSRNGLSYFMELRKFV